jgi:hypothetical protein
MNRGASAAVIDTNQPSANLKIGPSNPLTTLTTDRKKWQQRIRNLLLLRQK